MLQEDTPEPSEFSTTVVFSCCFVTKINLLFFSANSTVFVLFPYHKTQTHTQKPKSGARRGSDPEASFCDEIGSKDVLRLCFVASEAPVSDQMDSPVFLAVRKQPGGVGLRNIAHQRQFVI